MQVVAHRRFGEARGLGDGGGDARQSRRHAEVVHVGGGKPRLVQAAPDERHDQRQIAGVADPALFPLIVVFGFGRAVVIDEIGGAGDARQQARHRLAFADENGRGAVAGRHLDRARRLGVALVGGDDQRLGRAAERAGERGGARPLRCRHVERGDVFGERQRFRHHAGIEPVEEWKGRRGKPQIRDRVTVAAGERVARGLHRHGHRVFVPVAHGALALALRFQRRVEPAVGFGDGAALQADSAGYRRRRREFRTTWEVPCAALESNPLRLNHCALLTFVCA